MHLNTDTSELLGTTRNIGLS